MSVEWIWYWIFLLDDNSIVYSYENVWHARYAFEAIGFFVDDLCMQQEDFEDVDDNDERVV